MDKFRIVDSLNESFALNERNKAKKDAYIRSTGGRDNAPPGVYSDQEVYAENPHGSEGSMRGVRRRGAKPSRDEVETHRLGLKRRLQAKHRKDESTMTQEKFEAAYIRSNAQLAFVIAEGQTKLHKDAMDIARRRARKGATEKEIKRETARLVTTGEVFSGDATEKYRRERGAPTMVRTKPKKLAGPTGKLPG